MSLDTQFVFDQLRFVAAESFKVEYPENQARTILPVISQGAGDDVISYKQIDSVGKAQVISDYANDLPRSDVRTDTATFKIRTLAGAYGYSIDELRKAAKYGMNLDSDKAAATRQSIENLLDDIALFGDAATGLQGFVNNTNLTVGTAAQAITATSTDVQDLAVLNVFAAQIRNNTASTRSPDTLLLPETQFTYIAQKRLTQANMTVLQFFLATQPWIKTVMPVFKLAGAGASSTDRAIAFQRDKSVVRLEIPSEVETLEPERRGLEWTVAMMLTTAGVVMAKPKACYALDGV